MFGLAWCLVMAQNQFSLIKKKIGLPELSLTSHPLRPITSHFCLNPPPPLKVEVICISPLTNILALFSQKFDTELKGKVKNFSFSRKDEQLFLP